MRSPPNRRRFLGRSAGALGALAVTGTRITFADDPAPSSDLLMRKAVEFLRSRQEPDGSWSPKAGPGVTGIAVAALLKSKRVTPEEPIVTKGLAYLERFIGPKGASPRGLNPTTAPPSRSWRSRRRTSRADTTPPSRRGR